MPQIYEHTEQSPFMTFDLPEEADCILHLNGARARIRAVDLPVGDNLVWVGRIPILVRRAGLASDKDS